MNYKTKEIKTKFSTLFIRPEALKKIMYYAKAASGEVSGLGVVKRDKDKKLIVEDIYLLEQESSSGDTELKPEAVSKMMIDMIKAKKDPGELKFWWHSHANMSVFWSGTDDECAETLSKEFAFSLVVNKDGDRRCRLDLYHPFRLTIDHVKLAEIYEEDESLKEACEKEVQEKVKEPSWNTGYNNGFGYNEYNWNNHDGRRWKDDPVYKDKIEVSEELAEHVEKLTDSITIFEDKGGIFAKETWEDYFSETIKDIVKARYEKGRACQESFGTHDSENALCKRCRVKKQCKVWSEIWQDDFPIDEKEESVPDV